MLTDRAQSLRGFFLLLPDPASLQVMLRALRLA
jgi:chemotaxis protein CheC